ncbi:MAG: hypothetical protein KIT44_05475 [Opitutaceae bacterium]|nr:hypothetical protein [Opitutaceae bacterium]
MAQFFRTFFHAVSFLTVLASSGAGSDRGQPFSPEPPPRPKVLLDYYHRLKPDTRVGNFILTGGYLNSIGRYRTDDFSHTNSYDSFAHALESEFALLFHERPIDEAALRDVDILVINNPEDPQHVPGAPLISDEEIAAILAFVGNGGSLIVMLNSVGAAEENFESVQFRKLLNLLGVDWNSDNTHYSDIPISARHGYFYDIKLFHYGAGCTLRFLPHALAPEVWLEVKEDVTFPEVRGAGIVKVRYGRGKVLVVGDGGSWGGGNMSRPWADNRRFLAQLFRHSKPSRDVPMPSYPVGQTLLYDTAFTQLNVVPSRMPLAGAMQPGFKYFEPRPRTRIPYSETVGTLRVVCVDIAPDGVRSLAVTPAEFHQFDQPIPSREDDAIKLQVTRQGSILGIAGEGELSRWLAPSISPLVAFIPNDAIRVGDRWEKIQHLRVNAFRGADTSVTRPVEVEMLYLRDEIIDGRPCRVIRSQTEQWLPDIAVQPADFLPDEFVHQRGGEELVYMASRGGKLLFRMDQWVDRESSMVIKARSQSRLLVWLHPPAGPTGVTTAEKDSSMITSIAHVAEFKLRSQ